MPDLSAPSRIVLLVALLLALLELAGVAHAGPDKLVKDIERSSSGCATSDFVAGPGALFFGTADRCRGGLALWRSDGSAAGTRAVKVFEPGPDALNQVRPLLTVGGVLYFGLEFGSAIRELWRSDGTAQGTTLVWAFAPQTSIRATDGSATLAVLGDKLVFAVNELGGDTTLWSSDGTPQGTNEVSGLGGGSWDVAHFLVGDGIVYVLTELIGHQLWRTDGTTPGTELLADFGLFEYDDPSGGQSGFAYPGLTLGADGAVYFSRQLYPGPHEVWRSGGTPQTTGPLFTLPFASRWVLVDGSHFVLEARRGLVRLSRWDPDDGTLQLLHDFAPPPLGLNELTVEGWRDGVLYLTARVHLRANELWRSDGTGQGTFELYQQTLRSFDSGFLHPGANGFLFQVDPHNPSEPLLFTDGTVAGTLQVLAPDPYEGPFYDAVTPFGEATLFARHATDVAAALMRTDGTAAGTSLVHELTFAPSSIGVRAGIAALFSASTLWRSDGTPAGTFPLVELGPDTLGSGPLQLTDVAGTLLFDVAGPTGTANELWRSDGTRGGTRLVADLPDGADVLRLLTAASDRLFFARGASELWTSDGSTPGTQLLIDTERSADDRISEIRDVDGRTFVAVQGAQPTDGALWRSDGSVEGTERIADVAPSGLTGFDGKLLFAARTAPESVGIWRSDGSPSGTVPLATFSAIGTRRVPVLGRIFPVGGVAYFTVGWRGRTELWRSDGSSEGTTRVTTLPLGLRDRRFATPIVTTHGGVLDGRLVFSFPSLTKDDANLWRTDGTEAGTEAIAALPPLFDLGDFTRVGSRLLFLNAIPDLGFPVELWATDGTMDGTVRLLASAVRGLGRVTVGGLLYFCASDSDTSDFSLRIWQSDGTAEGTEPAFGGTVSCASELASSGGRLFFTKETQRYGSELWSILLPP